MQAAYDNEDDATFDDICEHYDKAEELSAGRFTPIDPPLGARSVVLEDADETVAPPRVHFEEKPKMIVENKTAFRTASVVHHDDRDLWRDWESPVLDMPPTQDSHFDAFTLSEDAIGETVREDCDEVFEDAVTAEVVSDLPPESFVEDFTYPPVRSSEIDKFYPPYYKDTDFAYFEAEDIAAPPQPPPPRQRIGGGGRVGLLHTALLTTFFFSAFMYYVEECDATAVTAQLAQPSAYEHACDFATPPAQGLVVSQHAYDVFDAFPEDFYEDPGPGNTEIDVYDNLAIRIRAFRALRGVIESAIDAVLPLSARSRLVPQARLR
ncbi:hypothetical protein CYMTET_55462 [Cymbomonas tetramitiformis]|uniref:Uncharacterized protein n=1 Tax=Cymbomonas tetramitiformis TaxID=36881 RepID=A0AAE0ENC3_9CHLO|nr:hypothetical protein CYMTET_55462 [Cymbomonas tetramitiformis]